MNWQNLHHEIIKEYRQKPLAKHLWVFCIGFGLGIFFGLLIFQDINLVLLIGLMTVALDYILFQNEILSLLSPHSPYWLQGTLTKKIKKQKINEQQEIEETEFYFEIEVMESHIFTFKEGLKMEIPAKIPAQIRVEVPESMFLSFKEDDFLNLVCNPNHKVYGWLQMNKTKPKKVIRIEK